MGIFDRLFGLGKAKKEPPLPLLPWERKPSIYEFIVAYAEDGQKLPDDGRTFSGSQIRFAAGAADGIATHHMEGNDAVGATALLNLVVEYCQAPNVQNKRKVYEQVTQSNAISVIDPLIQGLREASGINSNRLYELAKSFATKATDREPVKLGIALLGLFREENDMEIFRILGRHDEFTLFCAVALANADNPERELWELAKSVHGWGRIQAVEQLSSTEDPAIKDWLLREGYNNSVMYEYLAYTCATVGDLRSALEREDVDDELLASAGDIIDALLRGGPAEDIDSYDDGAAVVELYVEHLTAKASSVPDFLGVAAVKDFLSDDKADWDQRTSRGWTPELRTALTEQCVAVLERPMWRPLVRADLEATDDSVFENARQAAVVLGIESWMYDWKRLQDKPLEPGRWDHAMKSCGQKHIGALTDFAVRTLPLADIATGPEMELGMDHEHIPHQCLNFVLQGLWQYPGNGFQLIETGLTSPVVSNRNFAFRTLMAWGRSNWPLGTEATLVRALQREPDEKIREWMQKVIDGNSLD